MIIDVITGYGILDNFHIFLGMFLYFFVINMCHFDK